MRTIKYETLTVQEAQEMTPNAYDLELAKEKGLANNEIYDKNYLEVQAAYMSLVNYYLCEEIGLNDYQKYLDNCEYAFPEGEASVYKKMGRFDRNNIYIRNNVYVERLSKENIALLTNNMDAGILNVNDDLIQMVKETMQMVITVKYDDSDAKFEAIYDMGVFQTNVAPNDALVLMISYDFEYDDAGKLLSQENEDAKLVVIEELSKKITNEMSAKLGFDVCVFY